MTTGSIVRDFTIPFEQYQISHPSEVRTSKGWSSFGNYFSKTWTGTDYPPQKPIYERIYWRDPYQGKLHVYKRRVDKPVRTKSDFHPYSCSIFSRSSDWFQIERKAYGVPDLTLVLTTHGQFADGYAVDDAVEWKANDDIALIGKLREAVAGSDFNLGVFLGESHQALQMITNSASRIFTGLKYLKRGNIVGAAHALGAPPPKGHFTPKGVRTDLANAWLELQYGWLPLVGDAKAAAEFLAKQLEFPLVRTYKVRKRKAGRLVPLTSSFLAFGGRRETQGQIIARVSEANVAQLSGLLDPASVAWELLPWSFVADWFLPIGDYLAARSFVSSITGEFATTKTTRTSCSYTAMVITNSPPITETRPKTGYHSTTKVDVTRTVSTTLQVPLPNFKTFDKVASWRHCANAVALLTQLGSKKRDSWSPQVPWTPLQRSSKVF